MMASMETAMEYRQPTEDELVPAAQAGVLEWGVDDLGYPWQRIDPDYPEAIIWYQANGFYPLGAECHRVPAGWTRPQNDESASPE